MATKIRKSFPEEWLAGVAIPFLQDILNSPPFTEFVAWAELKEVCLPLGSTQGNVARGRVEATLGRQAGVLNSKHALPAVIGYRHGEREHFAQCIKFSKAVWLPFDEDTRAPTDLRFAAFATVAFALEDE